MRKLLFKKSYQNLLKLIFILIFSPLKAKEINYQKGIIMQKKKIFLGIDTGGTHTDAVIFEANTKSVLATAKAETTHNNLVVGIAEVLAKLKSLKWNGNIADIERIHLSTTLATNAIAESLGNRVGLLLMGYDQDQKEVRHLVANLPQVTTVFLPGAHNYYGQEETPLDEAALLAAAKELEPSVSAWAVSGFFSVRNPNHELAAARILKSFSDKPITMGHDLTGLLDAVRRGATAALNAGLVVIIGRLLDAVKSAAQEAGLGSARLMVVKGDGSLVSEEWAREKPIETVVSGPAAGLVGARVLSRGFLKPTENDLWVLDVGGTTSDLALLINGLPAVNPNGARVGEWSTQTMAVETFTRGLGGDSVVEIANDGLITLGPRRVLPLCRLARDYPKVLSILQTQVAERAPATTAGVFFLPGTPPEPGISADEKAILVALAQETPYSLLQFKRESFERGYNFMGLKALEHPCVLISSFTPTDALAILGLYTGGEREAAELGATILGRALGWSPEQVARRVLEEFGRAMVQDILTYAFQRDDIKYDESIFAEPGVLGSALTRRPAGHIEVCLKAKEPIILLGAPVAVLAPFMKCNIMGNILVPPNYDVASAAGAAASPVHLSRRVEIQALPYFTGYRLFLPDRVEDGESVTLLVARAEEFMTEYLRNLARIAGEENAKITFTRTDRKVTLNDGSHLDMGTSLNFTVVAAD